MIGIRHILSAAKGKVNVISQSTCWLAQRRLLTPSFLGLDSFKEQVKVCEERYGKQAEEFKVQLIERLYDPALDLLTHDCLSYIYLMKQTDLPYIVKLLGRYTRMARSAKAGMPIDYIGIDAIRQCHVLNCADTALRIYHSVKPTSADDRFGCLAVTMDAVYEDERYEVCVDLVLKELAAQKLDSERLNPLLTLGFIAAFRMVSMEGLSIASTILGELPKSAYLQQLLSVYCVNQGRLNAAIATLELVEQASFANTVISSNIKILLYLKNGNDRNVFVVLTELIKLLRESKNEKMPGVGSLLFKDVYKGIMASAKTDKHKSLLRVVTAGKSSLVHSKTAKDFLIQKITQSLALKAFATARALPLSPMLTLLDEVALADDSQYEDAEKLLEDLKSAKSKPTEPETSAPSPETNSSKPKKMEIVNGYIVFTDS